MPHHPSPTAMARDASASCSVVEPPLDRRRTWGPLPQGGMQCSAVQCSTLHTAVPYVANYCAVPGPRNGLHCMCSSPPG